MSIHPHALTLCLTLALAACGETEADSDAGSESAGTTHSEDSTGTGAPACVEDDLSPTVFVGPGYDADKGGLQEPLQDKYVASTTFLVLRPETAQEFGATVEAMIPALTANPGLVGFSTALSAKCGTARTLTVWRDQTAMMNFVTSDEHVAGMARAQEFSTTGTVTSWEVTRAELPLGWDTAIARATAATPSY
jgi:heme-degrading monooxygenase HmoA